MPHAPLFRVPLVLACLVSVASASPRADAPDPRESARQGVVAAADEALRALQQRRDAGEAMTPHFVRLLAEYPRRSCLADRLTGEPGPHIGSVLALVRSQEELYRGIPTPCFGDANIAHPQRAMAEYYLREAGVWLASPEAAVSWPRDEDTPGLASPPPAAALLVTPAREYLLSVMKRAEAGEALTPTFIDLLGRASRTVWRCELAAARSAAERLAVSEVHVERVKQALYPKIDISHYDPRGSEYLLREAELAVAQARAEVQGDVRPTPAEVAAGVALVTAAREAWTELQERADSGEAQRPWFIESVCESSRRLCIVECAYGEAEAIRAQALASHHGRMQKLHAALERAFDAGENVSRVQVSQALCFLREAQLWVAEARGK